MNTMRLWPDAEKGQPLPCVRFPLPPKIISVVDLEMETHDIPDDQVFLAVWADDSFSLCRYDPDTDACCALDRKTFLTGNPSSGIPYYIIPVTLDAQPKDNPCAEEVVAKPLAATNFAKGKTTEP